MKQNLFKSYEPEVDSAQGAEFGRVIGAVLSFIGILKLYKDNQNNFAILLVLIGAALLLAAWGKPRLLVKPAKLWLRFGEGLAQIVTPISLTFIYFLVLTPLSLLYKSLGVEMLDLKWKSKQASYFKKREIKKRRWDCQF